MEYIIMEYIIIVILAVLLLAAVIKIILYKRNLRALTREFKMLILEEGNGELHLGSPSSDVEKFLEVFHSYLEKTRENQLSVKKKEQELKDEIANISHDLRTPLTSMKGYLRLLQEVNVMENPKEWEEWKQYLAITVKKTEQLQYLVEQLYEYANLKDKVESLCLEKTELYGFFCNQILNYYHDFETKGIQVQLPEEQKCEVLADKQALERIFTNMIGNALKYGKHYWKIEIENKDHTVKMIFQNPANGLTTEEVSHLFERFYIQEQSRTVGGSGLGLTIAKMLMESMGGDMTARLEEDELWFELQFLRA